mgnify:CR=1
MRKKAAPAAYAARADAAACSAAKALVIAEDAAEDVRRMKGDLAVMERSLEVATDGVDILFRIVEDVERSCMKIGTTLFVAAIVSFVLMVCAAVLQ